MAAKLVLLAIAYLLGAIPFGYILVKYVFTRGEDVRSSGSGGTGATNVTRKAGRTAGLLTYLLDVGKGMAAVALMQVVAEGDYFWIGAAGVAAIIGHIFPVFLGFRGGKGVATGVGIYLLIAPYSVVGALVLWALTVYFTRYVSLASLVAAGALPLLSWVIYGVLQPNPHITGQITIAIAAFALILFAHRENVRRLMRGEEKRFGLHGEEAGQGATSGSRT
jgi:acyl phosphate:glycerol-3-phosphate acyltransferase